MKKYLYIIIGIIISGVSTVYAAPYFNYSQSIIPALNSRYYLGTTTPSTVGWKSVITDELCLTGDSCKTTWPTGGSGASPDWNKQTNYGVLTLTPTTTIPIWAKDAIYASSTLTVQGLTTLGNASSTILSGNTLCLTSDSCITTWPSGGGTFAWTPTTNFGQVANSTSTQIWFKGSPISLSASSTAQFVYASTTALTISGNSYLGTVSSGSWNGSSIGDSYIDDTITLTNLTQITNRAITDTTGTLTVGRGGTGQTSFGQGWLHSDGTTITSSTSPTVNYLTATSTTASSTLQNVNLNQLAFSDNSTQTLAYKATTTDVYVDCNMPQTGSEDFAPGGSWWQPIGSIGAWAFQDATSSSVYCISHIPKNMAATPNASIWTVISATTSGTAILNIEATTTASGQNYNPASYTVLLNASTTAASRLVITGSANYQGTGTSTPVTNTLNAGDDLIIRYRRHGENVNDTVNNDIFMPQMWLRLDVN